VEILTFNLLQYDIFVRGGMTVGPTHHSRDFVFGTAVTDAYLLERDSARSPIVLLSPEVVKDVEMLGTDFMQWLKEDGEGRFFIHYLMRYAEYTSAIEVGKVILTYPAARIAYFIGQRLQNDRGRVLAKAEWFQRYWNQGVAIRGVFPRIELGSQPKLPADSITILSRRLIAPTASR
jgi:hypothetical protein